MNYLETMKNIVKDKKRRKENLVFIFVLLVILLISMNYIFNEDKSKTEKVEKINQKEEENLSSQSINDNSLEERLTQIINQVEGISDVSLIINYKDSGVSEYVFNTKETVSGEGDTLNIEKEVAYNESSGQKSAIATTKTTPQVEGVIIVAKGIENSNIKQKLQSAIASLLGIASYKVQVLNRR